MILEYEIESFGWFFKKVCVSSEANSFNTVGHATLNFNARKPWYHLGSVLGK